MSHFRHKRYDLPHGQVDRVARGKRSVRTALRPARYRRARSATRTADTHGSNRADSTAADRRRRRDRALCNSLKPRLVKTEWRSLVKRLRIRRFGAYSTRLRS
jgi:hypothetical protein